MVTVPLPLAVTRPFESTLAIALACGDHEKVTPVSTLPSESFATAVNCTCAPMLASAVVEPLTVMVATGFAFGSTVTAEVPCLPEMEAKMVAVETVVACTVALPLEGSMEMTAASLELQAAAGAPATTFRFLSSALAVKICVAVGASVTVEGVTGTLSTACATVIANLPETPPAVAKTPAEPFASALTRPEPFTCATVAVQGGAAVPSQIAQVTVAFATACPRASSGAAASCTVSPRLVSVEGVPVTATCATDCCTVITIAPLWPPPVAVMVAGPLLTAFARPLAASTETTPAALLSHEKAVASTGLPRTSRAVAESCTVSSTLESVRGVPATCTVVTAGFTTWTVTDPSAAPMAATILVLPMATPVTVPLALTVAMVESAELQVAAAEMAWPFASTALAARSSVAPRSSEPPAGTMATLLGACCTSTVRSALFPPELAVIFALPFATAVTRPASSTVATAGSADAKAMPAEATTFPAASTAWATNCRCAPSAATVGGDPSAVCRSTEATICGGGSCCPPEHATMINTIAMRRMTLLPVRSREIDGDQLPGDRHRVASERRGRRPVQDLRAVRAELRAMARAMQNAVRLGPHGAEAVRAVSVDGDDLRSGDALHDQRARRTLDEAEDEAV